MTPLAEKLIARIRAEGPMTIAEYMAACLGDPQHGYYFQRQPFGRGGDFVTAPEISQIIGELIGLWALATWQRMGTPAPFILAELGPGRGTLMGDALRAAAIRREFSRAVRVHLVETSPRLRIIQKKKLVPSTATVAWHEEVSEIPSAPTILFANEFFDALPIRQFVRAEKGWAERMVGIGEDGGLAFGLRPAPPPFHPANPDRGEGVVEISQAAEAMMTVIAERLANDGGSALVIDYGYTGPAFGDTLQAVRAHAYDDPLAAPGQADLTAHVDFGALATAARQAGALPRRVMAQGEFLMRMGLLARADALAKGKDEAARASIAGAAERLAGGEAMGTLFKVLAISSPRLALPVFDDNPAGEIAEDIR